MKILPRVNNDFARVTMVSLKLHGCFRDKQKRSDSLKQKRSMRGLIISRVS